MKRVLLADIQHKLNTEKIRTFQLIHGAIMTAASFFFLMILFFYFTGFPSKDVSPHTMANLNIFSFFHGGLFVVSLIMSKFLYNRMFSEQTVLMTTRMIKDDNDDSLIGGYITLIRTAEIIRAAVLEGPVFLGLVVCFMGVTGGVIYQYQYYWLNALSYVFFMYIMIKEFPSKANVLEVFKTKLRHALLY